MLVENVNCNVCVFTAEINKVFTCGPARFRAAGMPANMREDNIKMEIEETASATIV
jgi:hypothetical protein